MRILALDGGGTWAGVLANALGEIFGPDTPGREIIRSFSYVAGNSGGSIVLAALCCDYTPRQVAGFYDDSATLERMFSPKWTARVPILRHFVPRYSTTGKLRALSAMLDESAHKGEPLPSTVKLRDWPRLLGSDVNIVIPAFDHDRQRTTFFRSNPASLAKSSDPPIDPTLLEAIHASSTAPVLYFDEPASFLGRRYWDGALGGYNNPVLAAVVEALSNRPDAADALRVLSIGTSAEVRPLAGPDAPPPIGKPIRSGWFDTLRMAATVILDDPPDAATFHAHVALRQPLPAGKETAVSGSVVRLSPLVRPEWTGTRWQVPGVFSAEEFESLVGMRMDVMDGRSLALIRKLTRLWITGEVPNQPIRMGAQFRCDVGLATFAAAKAHWEAIAGDHGWIPGRTRDDIL